jgi:hypothetical protein
VEICGKLIRDTGDEEHVADRDEAPARGSIDFFHAVKILKHCLRQLDPSLAVVKFTVVTEFAVRKLFIEAELALGKIAFERQALATNRPGRAG